MAMPNATTRQPRRQRGRPTRRRGPTSASTCSSRTCSNSSPPTWARPTRARGYPPFAGDHALIIEVPRRWRSSGSSTWRCGRCPAVEPGHPVSSSGSSACWSCSGRSGRRARRAGQAILDGTDSSAADQLRPRVLYHDVIEDITDQHAVILNRNRQASMVMPGRVPARLRDDAGAVRRGGRQRGRAGGTGHHPGRRADDRRRRAGSTSAAAPPTSSSHGTRITTVLRRVEGRDH